MKKGYLSVRFLMAIGLAFVLSPSYAAVEMTDFDLETTHDLAMLCGAGDDDVNYSEAKYACNGFLKGVAQYHHAVVDHDNLKPLFCYDRATTLADGKKAFVGWALANKGNDALMQEPAVKGAVRGLAAGYPCK